ncbi:MAG: hypothetical protein Q7U28_03200 [Aquabacterium sp.]|nr:hypothetical protein [Aquabacterium sp.]
MPIRSFASLALAASLFHAPVQAQTYQGSTFQQVWGAAQSGRYAQLPEEQVTVGSFYSGATDLLQQASSRTLSDRSDVLPRFQKLLHRNGICLSGTWNITESTPYTGYFKQNSRGLIIMRASSALTAIHRGEKRAFGIAGKIFPTTNEGHAQPLHTANFFVIDNLGGTLTPNFLDSALTNDITAIDFKLDDFDKVGLLGAAVKAFGFAEQPLAVLTVRQLYEISSLGEAPYATIITPKYIKIQGQLGGVRSQFDDFRDDLRVSSNGGAYKLDIFVNSDGLIGFQKTWTKVGFIEVKKDAAADGCDHQVHFHHPKWQWGLRHN